MDVLVLTAPVLARDMEELLTPADLEEEPMPPLVLDTVVATLGL